MPLLLPGHSSNKIIRPHANSGRRFFAGNASLHKNLMLALITFSPDQHTALLPRHTATLHTATLPHCHTATLPHCHTALLPRHTSNKIIQLEANSRGSFCRFCNFAADYIYKQKYYINLDFAKFCISKVFSLYLVNVFEAPKKVPCTSPVPPLYPPCTLQGQLVQGQPRGEASGWLDAGQRMNHIQHLDN